MRERDASPATTNAAPLQPIEILDGQGTVVATLQTHDPEWSLAEYIRNRPADQWRWRPKSA